MGARTWLLRLGSVVLAPLVFLLAVAAGVALHHLFLPLSLPLPGAVRFVNSIGYTFCLARIVAGTAEDTAFGVQAVVEAEIVGCRLCEHHDAANTSWRYCL